MHYRPNVRIIPRSWIKYTEVDGTPVYREMTPTEHKRRRKALKQRFAALLILMMDQRVRVAKAVEEWQKEAAADFMTAIHNEHWTIQRELYLLRTVPVRKYAHVSNAAERRLRGGAS